MNEGNLMKTARKLVQDVKNGKIDGAVALQQLHAEVESAKFNAELEAKFGRYAAPLPPNTGPEESDVERELGEIQAQREAVEKQAEDVEEFVKHFKRLSGF